MSKLIVLGSGNAQALSCFNTCFAIANENEYFLVDAGGGNGILRQLSLNQIPLSNIHHLFISHSHSDHLVGVIWLVRMIGSLMDKGAYQGNLKIYCHAELVATIKSIVSLTVQERFYRFFDERMIFQALTDGEEQEINGERFRFFDIASEKCRQFGFHYTTNSGFRVLFAGDEPLREELAAYLRSCELLLHEAYCLYAEREIFEPYEKFHVTVKEAAELAEKYAIKHLLLWHTEDSQLERRKLVYSTEAALYYGGSVWVPDDNEVLELPLK